MAEVGRADRLTASRDGSTGPADLPICFFFGHAMAECSALRRLSAALTGSSSRLFGVLLEAGARIYHYEPSMIRTKSLIVDGLWPVAGSTSLVHKRQQ